MKQSAKSAAKQADMMNTISTSFGALPYEITSAVREFAERGVQQAKLAYDRAKAVAEDAAGVLEGSYANLTKGYAELNLKALEVAKANTDAAFDVARSLTSAQSFAEVVEAQTAYMRSRFDAGIAQTKELAALANKVANETAGPAREGFRRSLAQLQSA